MYLASINVLHIVTCADKWPHYEHRINWRATATRFTLYAAAPHGADVHNKLFSGKVTPFLRSPSLSLSLGGSVFVGDDDDDGERAAPGDAAAGRAVLHDEMGRRVCRWGGTARPTVSYFLARF